MRNEAPCVEVCPFDVLQMREISAADWGELTVLGKLKTVFHGRRKAFAARPEDCRACGLCVAACPEKAVKLVAYKQN